MKSKFLSFVTFFFGLSILSMVSVSHAETTLVLEGGQVWQNRNDLRIPAEGGTRLDFNEFNEGPFPHYRLEVKVPLGKHHGMRALYAPFDITVNGEVPTPLEFNGETFLAEEPLSLQYKFNSYRLSYIYGFWGFDENQLNLGFTLKVRDAEIELSQGDLSSAYDNVGLVPLFYFEYQRALHSKWLFSFTLDASAAPQGRAIDGALKLRRRLGSSLSLGIGGRSLEGGADNEKVFTFSWFNYWLADLVFEF